MIHTEFFIGEPVSFKGLCKVYPPKIKDVVANPKYGIYLKLITISQEEIEDEWNKKGLDMATVLTPMEYLLNNVYHDKLFHTLAKEAFQFFLHEEVYFLFEQKQILIGEINKETKIDNLRFLEEKDYFDFQNLVRDSIGDKAIEPPNPNEHPKIKAMKAKARERDRVKAKSGKGLTLLTSMSSICCMGYGINPLNIGELSYAALPIMIQTYQEKEKYELDVDSLLAGADSKKIKPKYWIRNLEN